MTQEEKLQIEQRIIDVLKTVYDPEIPVNVYDLGLIYRIDLDDEGHLDMDMTLTAPNCPAADFIMEDVRQRVESVEGVKSLKLNVVFEPTWDKEMMSDEAKLDLGLL
ncbi:iron-sulfur cluster assembly protein [Alloprevotella tannerae]|jgi:feS assembly SUF system protein|uniref:iron-sulfur cluster assembly protein n=1 Tax=Alloprevotella tannerae TaxID=76122 RepID=UPI0025CFE379|nr:iron-sulfur cluster assembly protein [Alloprevotella tannerae]